VRAADLAGADEVRGNAGLVLATLYNRTGRLAEAKRMLANAQATLARGPQSAATRFHRRSTEATLALSDGRLADTGELLRQQLRKPSCRGVPSISGDTRAGELRLRPRAAGQVRREPAAAGVSPGDPGAHARGRAPGAGQSARHARSSRAPRARFEKAIVAARRELTILERAHGPDSPLAAGAHHVLASSLVSTHGRPLRFAVTSPRRASSSRPPTARVAHLSAIALEEATFTASQGDARAIELCRETCERMQESGGTRSPAEDV